MVVADVMLVAALVRVKVMAFSKYNFVQLVFASTQASTTLLVKVAALLHSKKVTATATFLAELLCR